jgi:acetyl-CoA synthetase
MSDFNQEINAAEVYTPPPALQSKAHVSSMEQYAAMYKASIEDPEKFFGDMAKEAFHWETPFASVGPNFNFDRTKGDVSIKWFEGGKTNLCYNCLDKNIKAGLGDRKAILYECNDVDDAHKAFTYQELFDLVCKLANALKAKGVKKGDRVSIYLPMTVELPAAMLACARIGAIHSVVFGGFSADALCGRIADAQSKVVITADGVMRGTKPVQLKAITDKACELAEKDGFKVETVLCVGRLKGTKYVEQVKHDWVEGRDVWFDEFVNLQSAECAVEWMESEEPLFMLYTSGSTGKPKGVLHTTAGYMLGAYATMKYTFDYHPEDIWFCTADCGWITGHTYITYGPMLNGATQVLFEGVPTHPAVDRFWDTCEKYKVSIFYTAPTAIRALMKSGDEPVKKHNLSSLRLLGTVGEPINPEAWRWYHSVVGGGRCPIADTYWQTETGGHLITPLAGAHNCKPGSASLPFFGVEPAILDQNGREQEGECSGALVLKRPNPSMMRTVFGDHKRFEEVYFSQHNGYYFTGDGCKRDKDGFYWLTGRIDDVINVSGHRIGTAEVESALVAFPKVAEAACVGFPHDIKGEGIWCYVTLKEGVEYDDALKPELKKQVREIIGAFAMPDEIHWAPGLPKTRSGKIMRRILRKLALPDYDKQELGDTSTLADPSVVDQLKKSHPRPK